jgi:AAA ATPase
MDVEELLKKKEMELQKRINEAILNRDEKAASLKYSNIPDRFRDMEFKDLIINRDNKQIVEHCINYVKAFNGHQKGIGLIGDMGVGKTTLMSIMGQHFIKKGYRVYFATEEAILDEVKRSFDNRSYDNSEDIIRRIGKNDIVMIDELGQTTSEWGLATLKRVIDTVINNNNRLFITTNYNSKELLERWGNSKTYKTPHQVVDRLQETMNFYMVKGKSFRAQDIGASNVEA